MTIDQRTSAVEDSEREDTFRIAIIGAHGGDNDGLVQAAGVGAATQLGDGDDVYRHEGSGPLPEIDGGAGFDRLILASTQQHLIGDKVSGFEQLVIASGPNFWVLDKFSGFSTVAFEPGGSLNFLNSVNPNADLAMDGGFVIVGAGSRFRNVTGTAAAEIFELNHGAIGSVSLGAGDDTFAYNHFTRFPMGPSISGLIDGGPGWDTIALSVEGGRTIDLANMTGFERVNTGNFTTSSSDVRLLNVNGFLEIETALQGKLTIAQSSSPNATVRLAYPTTLILESNATVGAVGVASASIEAAQIGNAALSVSVTNNGTVIGDVRLGVGNDVFDGRLGTVGGSIYGYAGNDRLIGSAGADRVFGGFGDDLIFLDAGGDDVANGGDGFDQIFYGAALTAADANNGGAGTDVVILQGNYVFTMGASNLVDVEYISLQSGSSTRYGEAGTNSYDYDITFIDANVGAGQRFTVNASQLLAGESFVFDGAAEANGYFLVYAGYGDDDLTGGSGNDLFHFEGTRWGAGDEVDGKAGVDSLIVRGSGGMNSIVFGETQVRNMESITVSDRFGLGPAGRPSYDLTLANGNVTPGERLVLNGSTLLDPGQVFNVDASAVTGGRLTLYGGAGSDRLIGGGGDDLFYAAGGQDVLTGGGGADSFQVRSLSDSSPDLPDRILDFASSVDKIDLRFLDADANVAGDQAFTFIGNGTFQRVAGQLRAYDTGLGYWRVEGDVNGDGAADFALDVTLAASNLLASTDFIL